MADAGVDIRFDGDLDPLFGTVTGRAAIVQAAVLGLQASSGSLEPINGDTSWGFDVLFALNEDLNSRSIAAVQASIRTQLLRDERVLAAAVQLTLNESTDELVIDAKIRDAEGVFTLVLGVDRIAANIKILQSPVTTS